MNVFCITFSVTLQVDSTGPHASKLVNNAGEVNRIESFLFYTQQCYMCKLFSLLVLIGSSLMTTADVKINFSLLSDLSQDAIEKAI